MKKPGLISQRWPELLIGAWVLLFLLMWPRWFFESEGGLFASIQTVWADWALHLVMARRFESYPVNHWFTDHPLFAGEPFNYPFLISLFTAFFLKLGVSEVGSMLIPTVLSTVGFVGVLYLFYCQRVQHRSDAALAVCLFLLGGGWAFFKYFSQGFASESVIDFLLSTPPEYYNGPQDGGPFQYGGMLNTRLLPQRAMPLGLLCGTLVFLGLHWLKSRPSRAIGGGVALGLLVGLFPIVHVHTVVGAGVGMVFFLAPHFRQWRTFLPFALSAAVFTAIFYSAFHLSSVKAGFIVFQPGWMAATRNINFFIFWLLNWGLFLPLLVSAVTKLKYQKDPYFWAGILLFILCNFIRFQPWEFDNTKIFTWSYLFLAPVVSEILGDAFRGGNFGRRAVIVTVYLSLILSGAIELRRLLTPSVQTYQMYSRADFELARDFRPLLTHQDRVLAADVPHHWVTALAGGQVVMGYDGWVYSYGFPWEKRKQDLQTMYQGGVEGLALLRQYRVRYVIMGPEVRGRYEVNEEFFAKRFAKVLDRLGTKIYDLNTASPEG